MQNNENEIVYLYLDDIIPNRFQPRQVFDEKALKELALSIKEHGVIQPIIVRNIGNKYEIIAGERRYKASALAGLTKIPAIVRNLDDKESSKVALLENLQRKNLNPIEEARTYQKILELDQMTQEELAKTMGKSQGSVANKIRLLSLTDEVQDALLKEQISERHARTLLNISDPAKQKEMLKEVIAKKMTVRELEEVIKPPKEQESTEISPSDIERLLQPNPQPIVNSTNQAIPSVVPQTTSTLGIDYNTPPKFIDYGESTPTNNVVNSSDDLLKNVITGVEEDETTGTGEEPFQFFTPYNTQINSDQVTLETNPIKIPSIIEEPKVGSTNDIFGSTPPIDFTANEATSMDSLLQSVNPVNESIEEKNDFPPIDTYNNPFAKNPIFADDIQKIEENKKIEEAPKKKYNLNESIDLIRKIVQDIEFSGFKVDTEEMNFDRNYQIVIKIAKNQDMNEK